MNDEVQLYSSWTLVSSATVMNDKTVAAGGNDSMCVSSGGTANRTTLNSGGMMFVSSGGVASSTIVNLNGVMFINPDGVASSTIVNSGGIVTVGGTATDVAWTPCVGIVDPKGGAVVTYTSNYSGVYFGSADTLLSSAAVMTEKSLANGHMYVMSGGTANQTAINSSGYLNVWSGGEANSTTVNSGGGMVVYSGGVTNSATLNADGWIFVSSGGTANRTTVNSGGVMSFLDGVVNHTTVNSGGRMTVWDGMANITTVNSGGYMYVQSSGVVSGSLQISNGAMVSVESGAVIDFTVAEQSAPSTALINNWSLISGGADATYFITVKADQADGNYVLADGAADFAKSITVKNTAGSELGTLSVGGTLTYGKTTYTLNKNSTILSLGISSIHDEVKLYSRGRLVSAATVMNGKIVESCGNDSMCVSSGGTANSTTIKGDGFMRVYNGGVANSTTVNDGRMVVSSGGVASSTTVNKWGNLYVSSGGTATDVGWTPCVGRVEAADGAVVTYTSNYSGVYFGSENQLLSSSLVMTNKIVSGSMYVMSGGVANSTTVNSGGEVNVWSGGEANRTVVYDCCSMHISSGGVATRTTIYGRGCLYVSSGGVATRTIVNDMSYLCVSNGGMANQTIIFWGGHLRVCSGGVADSTTVNSGGWMDIRGGIAHRTTISKGGSMFVSSDGVVSGALQIDDGAVVSAYSGAVIDFTVAEQTEPSTALINNLSLIQGGANATYTITVKADQADGAYVLANGAAGFDKTVTLKNTSAETLGVLSVNGDAKSYNGIVYTLQNQSDSLVLSVADAIFYCSSWTESETVSVIWHGNTYKGTVGNGIFFRDYAAAKTAVSGKSTNIVLSESGTVTSVSHYDAQNVTLASETAVYTRMVIGGELKGGNHLDYAGSYTVNIEAGTFASDVAGGDAANGLVLRTGDVTVNVSGGTFAKSFTAGSYYATEGSVLGVAAISGDVTLTISGGSFDGRVYGGCGAMTDTLGACARLQGDAYLTIDASSNAISFGECIAAGNRGHGALNGSTNVTVTGQGANLAFADASVLFGGCSGDCYSTDGGVRTASTSVTGKRNLTFSAFTGDFDAEIRMFSEITLENNTSLNFSDAKLDLKEMGVWNFDCTSFASNLNKNQFAGDTINVDTTDLASSWTLLSGDVAAFADLGSALSVSFSGSTATWSGSAWSDGTYTLALDDQKTSLIVSKIG